MTESASNSNPTEPSNVDADDLNQSPADLHEGDYYESDSQEDDSSEYVSEADISGARIYFMNLSGSSSEDGGVYLSKVTFEDKNGLTGEGREVRQGSLSSPVELSYRALHLLPVLDIDHNGIVSRVEMDSAAADPKYKGTDAQVIAGLSARSSWDRIANFSNDERGNETGISSEDVWTIAERQNDVAVQAAYAAAIANHNLPERTAGQ